MQEIFNLLLPLFVIAVLLIVTDGIISFLVLPIDWIWEMIRRFF